MPYLPYVERVVEQYSKSPDLFNPQEALAAFHRIAGAYKDSEAWFEERTRLFFDYLAFDHPSRPYPSILHRYFVEHLAKIRREDLVDVMRGLLSTHLSAFEIARVGRDTVILRDLVGQGRFRVTLPEGAYGFVLGVVVSARIIPLGGGLLLGRGILLHPDLATPYILKLLEELKRENILSWQTPWLLSRMKLQYDMSPTYKLSSIYSPKSFLIKR